MKCVVGDSKLFFNQLNTSKKGGMTATVTTKFEKCSSSTSGVW